MKTIMTFLLVLLATSTFAQKHTSTVSGEATATNATHKNIKGHVVKKYQKACNLYIMVEIDGEKKKLFPINLPEEFDRDGADIVFDYLETNDAVEPGCYLDAAVSVSNVRKPKLGK